jgi:hypothetical protein
MREILVLSIGGARTQLVLTKDAARSESDVVLVSRQLAHTLSDMAQARLEINHLTLFNSPHRNPNTTT